MLNFNPYEPEKKIEEMLNLASENSKILMFSFPEVYNRMLEMSIMHE